ncbi:hypothetical protein Mapa_011315 [Marchantia paleacea]|nr:hypothetical protein Mapa_011315 [Marchantia paleacea]
MNMGIGPNPELAFHLNSSRNRPRPETIEEDGNKAQDLGQSPMHCTQAPRLANEMHKIGRENTTQQRWPPHSPFIPYHLNPIQLRRVPVGLALRDVSENARDTYSLSPIRRKSTSSPCLPSDQPLTQPHKTRWG